jgi:hypothetical protein
MAEIAGLTDESVCPTAVRQGERRAGFAAVTGRGVLTLPPDLI